MALGSFELDIQRFVDKAKGNTDLVVRRVALDLFRRVIMKSPVDEGRFKGAWLCAVGTIPTGDPGTIDKTGNVSFARVNAAVLEMRAGQVVTLCNNLSYSTRLEFGHSKQAPAGMVRLTLAEYPQVVNKVVGEVSK